MPAGPIPSAPGLTRRDLEPAVSKAIRRRIVTAQALYALGAVIGYFDTPVGVGAIFLTQLNYAIAPRCRFCRGFDARTFAKACRWMGCD